MKRINKKEIFFYSGWCRNVFEFENKDKSKTLRFVPYYRSSIYQEITIGEAIKEGCEDIHLNGELIHE